MKVKDLVKKLQTSDQESLVVVRGMDEEGYANVNVVETIQLQSRKSEGAIAALGEYEKPTAKDKTQVAILIDHS